MSADELDELAINTIRTLSIEAVQQAKSGHPGTPMALAPLVYTACVPVRYSTDQSSIDAWPLDSTTLKATRWRAAWSQARAGRANLTISVRQRNR